MKTLKRASRPASFAGIDITLKNGFLKFTGFVALLLLAFTCNASADILTVGDSGENYTSIQAAVDAANDSMGDTILVSPGVYHENVIIDKTLSIISTSGSSETSIVGNSTDNTLTITADGVAIDGFNISGATDDAMAGIYLTSANNTISNNLVHDNEYGIRLYSVELYKSVNNILENNTVNDNDYGIYLYHSNNATLKDNSMLNNNKNFGVEGDYGVENDIDTSNTVDDKPIYYLIGASNITLDSSTNAGTVYCINSQNITIKDLTLNNNRFGVLFHGTVDSKVENVNVSGNRDGICLWYDSDNNVVTNNIATGNQYGIAIRGYSEDNLISNNQVSDSSSAAIQVYAGSNTISDNTVTSNLGHGISVDYSNNTITNNMASDNRYMGIYVSPNGENTVVANNTVSGNNYDGIIINGANKTTVNSNKFINNTRYGIHLLNSVGSLIYDNLFSNDLNVYFAGNNSGNVWNITATLGTNIFGGEYIGGNYWANPEGTGFSQTENDSTADGFCDNSYIMDADNIDYLPLTGNIIVNEMPTAEIVSISPNPAQVGDTVTFTGNGNDTDGTIADYRWISSIDGELNNSASFSTTYLSEGNHTIAFSVRDNDGSWSGEVTEYLLINATSSGNETESTEPYLINVTPASGTTLAAGTTTVNVRFNYSDADADINGSTIRFTFDGENVTAANETTITDSYAAYNATGLVAGTYSAYVYVADDTGEDAVFSTSFTIASASTSSGSSGSSGSASTSSGGSGGGGGSSGEAYENILIKEVRSIYIIKTTHINYEFTKDGNAITSVQFDSLKNSGSIRTAIEVLKARSAFADTDVPGKLYQQMNIWVGKSGFVNTENVEKPLVTFKVERSWMAENNVEAENVALYRYANNVWNKLPTKVTETDDDYVYFESETTGFSAFAISSETTLKSTVDEEETPVGGNVEHVASEEESADTAETDDQPSETTNAAIMAVMGALVLVLIGGYLLYGQKRRP